MPVRLGRGRGARRGDPGRGVRVRGHRCADPGHDADPVRPRLRHQAGHGHGGLRGGRRGAARPGRARPARRDPASAPAAPGRARRALRLPLRRRGRSRPWTRSRTRGSSARPAPVSSTRTSATGSSAKLLEEATGRDLAGYARERVLGPLGLDGFRIATACPGAATRYTPDGRPYPEGLRTSHPGATLGWATASQLALFAQSWPRLLKPQTAAAVLDAVPIGEHLGYGLGWCVSRGEGPLLVSHGGGMGGVAAMAVSAPELGLSVAVLTNTTAKAARDAVVNHVLGELVPGFAPELISPVLSVPAHAFTLKEGSGRATPRHRRARSRCGCGSCRAPAPRSPPAARPPPPPSTPRPPSRCAAPSPCNCRPPTRGSAVRCSVWNCVRTRGG